LEILISLGASANDANPTRTAATWQQFVQWLHTVPRSAAGITPAEYEHLKAFPTKSPEGMRLAADKSGPYVVLADFGAGKRALVNVVGSYGVPLDFDGGHITADVIRTVLAGYSFVAYTTYAHGHAGMQRWRVFVPVAAPMDNAAHYATWEMLNAAFGGVADPAAKDPSRLSYLPGKCLYPEQAAIFFSDGAFLQPAPVIVTPPSALQAQTSDGPLPGWAGPSDDETLIAIACAHRLRPDERFGGPVHFAMLWTANEQWLTQQYPPSASEAGQPYSRTQADMALAGELAYWTGNDEARMRRLMIASGLSRPDEDWQERKVARAVERAISNAKVWHFMQKPPKDPPPTDGPVSQMTVNIGSGAPPPPDVPADSVAQPMVAGSATDAALANAMPGLNDYWAYLPTAQFIHRPTGMLHVASSVDGTIGKDARAALIVARPVHKMTWAPGYPERFQIKDIDPTDERGSNSWLYNKYQPPKAPDKVGDVSPWLNLLRSLYPDDFDHIVHYFADAVQFPQFKCNHALVLGSGVHGIGKDTLLAPVRHAVGEKNFWAIKPNDIVGTYNPWVATRLLQVSESRDLGDQGHGGVSRYELYERCKDLCAAPPTMLTCNDKYIAQHPVLNVLRLLLTTNHMVDGIYLPPEDRRHYCAWSEAEKMDEETATAMWEWYAAGGMDFVANYLATLDLSATTFNRAAPPPQTAWWHQLVEGGKPAEDDRFSDAVEKMGTPEWVTLNMVAQAGGLELAGWIAAPGNKRKVEREMDRAGYRRFPNPHDKRGRWYVGPVQMPVYRRANVRAVDLLRKFNGAAPV
jgi:hypothetical protein